MSDPMKTKSLIVSAAFACLAPCFVTSLRADVQVVGIALGGIGPLASYTVPDGKVLLVENLSASFSTNVPTVSRIILEVGLQVQNNAIATIQFGYPIADQYTAAALARPLRIPAGRSISLYTDSNRGYNNCRIQGLLVDTADLYAANIGVDLKSLGIEAGRFQAEATLASAHPARVSTKVSTNLAEFSADPTGASQRISTTKWEISTAADSDRKFLIAKATAMESKPVFPTKLGN